MKEKILLVALAAVLLSAMASAAPSTKLTVPLVEYTGFTIYGSLGFSGNAELKHYAAFNLLVPAYATASLVFAPYSPGSYVKVYINGVLVYDTTQNPINTGYVLLKPGRANVTVLHYLEYGMAGDPYNIAVELMLSFNATGTFDNQVLATTLSSAYDSFEVKPDSGLADVEVPSGRSLIVLSVSRVFKVESAKPVAYTDTEVRYTSSQVPAPKNDVKVYTAPVSRPLEKLTFTVKYPSGEVREHLFTPSQPQNLLVGTELYSPKGTVNAISYPGSIAVAEYFLNGTRSESIKLTAPGLLNLTTVYVVATYLPAGLRPVPTGLLHVFRSQAQVHAYKLELAPDPDAPVTVRYQGQPPSLDLAVAVAGAKAVYPGVATVLFNLSVSGVMHTPRLELNESTHVATLKPGLTYTVREGEKGTEFNRIVVVGGSGSVSFTSPVSADASVSNAFAIVVNATRPTIRVYQDGKGVQYAVSGNYAIVPTKYPGTYDIRLATKLKVVNIYKGEKIDATVEVYSPDGLVARATGKEVEFTLEPLVPYTVRGDNGNQVVSASVTLQQDGSIALEFTQPPAAKLPTELIMLAILVLLVVILLVAATRGLKLKIEGFGIG